MEVFSYEELCIIKEAIDFARGEDTDIDDKLYGRVWSKVLDLITETKNVEPKPCFLLKSV